MSDITHAIQELAYIELLVVCKVKGCLTLFEPSLEEPATDPVDEWAADIALRAVQAGWSVHPDGRVVCPIHRQHSK